MKRVFIFSILIAALLAIGLSPARVMADAPVTDNPITISTAFPALVAAKGSTITFSLDLTNRTQVWEELALQVDGPADWNPTLKSTGYTVRQVMIEPGKSQSVDLELKPPKNAQAQDYTFDVKAVSQDGTAVKDLPLVVTLQDKTSKTDLKMTTDYPDLKGPASNSFTFNLSVTNDSDQDRTVNFDTTVPQDWQVTIKPSYQSTQVSSISMKANGNQSIDVTVTPPHDVPAGTYPIAMRASTGSDTAQIPLNVVIVGNDAVSLDSASGQLNTQATVDSPTKFSLVVKNTGSSPLQNVSVSASTPNGWDVSFNPAKIDTLPVGQSTQVDATIKPGPQALAGDYMVSMTASAGSVSDSKDIRVTVETPTTWGFAAVGAMAVVIIGLGLVFARYSRR
jgi:uncharacterized membrane protein